MSLSTFLVFVSASRTAFGAVLFARSIARCGVQGRSYRFDEHNQLVMDEYVIQVKSGSYEVLGKVDGESIMKD